MIAEPDASAALEALRLEHEKTEEQLAMLQNLYSASLQFLAAMTPADVTRVVTEVLEGLVGATAFSLFSWRPGERLGRPLMRRGPGGLERISAFKREVNAALGSERPTTVRNGEGRFELAIAPLHFEKALVGAVVIEALLPQKHDGLSETDFELLLLLTAQTAPALVRAQKYAQAEANQTAVGQLLAAPPTSSSAPAMQGKLADTKLVDVLQLISMTQKSGLLLVTDQADRLEFRFAVGAVHEVNANDVTVELPQAPAVLTQWLDRAGRFAFFTGAADPNSGPTMGCDELVMEAFRLYDESHAGASRQLPDDLSAFSE